MASRLGRRVFAQVSRPTLRSSRRNVNLGTGRRWMSGNATGGSSTSNATSTSVFQEGDRPWQVRHLPISLMYILLITYYYLVQCRLVLLLLLVLRYVFFFFLVAMGVLWVFDGITWDVVSYSSSSRLLANQKLMNKKNTNMKNPQLHLSPLKRISRLLFL